MISIIIPTLNRCNDLLDCIDSIYKQNLNSADGNAINFEVLVIDNGSNDDTRIKVLERSGLTRNLYYLYEPKPGLHSARHAGLQQAKGDILAYLDDDVIVSRNWLIGIEQAFNHNGVVLAGGDCIPKFDCEEPEWFKNLWRNTSGAEAKIIPELSLVKFSDNIDYISPYLIFGCNFSVAKDFLKTVGGFHPDGMPKSMQFYRGDGETHVANEIIEKGLSAMHSKDAWVYHRVKQQRLTSEYFYNRGYSEAFTSAYAQLRRNGGNTSNLAKRRLTLLKLTFLILLNNFQFQNRGSYSKMISYKIGFLEGSREYVNEYRRNQELRDWVSRRNYL
jgi:glycosyltransferase involved in cell wall biosynthesis